MSTQIRWEQLPLPFDIGEKSSRWACPNCKAMTVMLVRFDGADVYIHKRKMCIRREVESVAENGST